MDDQVFFALQELLKSAPGIPAGVFLVGGTAMWDWWYVTAPPLRAVDIVLEEPRITQDVDLGMERRALQLAGDPAVLKAALTGTGWIQVPQKEFIWTNARWGNVTIELLASVGPGEPGGQPVWVKDADRAKVLKACATLTRLDPMQGLLEECRHPSIAVYRLARLTQLGLLLSKLIAVSVVLEEFSQAERERRAPSMFCARLGKDRHDALLLLGLSVRAGLSHYAARTALQPRRGLLEEDMHRIIALTRRIPDLVPTSEQLHLRELSAAVDQWWSGG